MVKEVVLTFLPRFELYINGELAGTLSKELSFFRPRYNIDFNGWHVEGDFFEWDYQIEDEQGNQVASISKDLWHMTDHYVIEVNQSGGCLGRSDGGACHRRGEVLQTVRKELIARMWKTCSFRALCKLCKKYVDN